MKSLPTRKRNSSFDFQVSKVFLKEKPGRRPAESFKFKIFLKRIFKLVKWLFPIILIFAAVYSLYFFAYKSGFFSIKEVSVQGAYAYVNHGDVLNIASNKLLGQNMLAQEVDGIENLLKKNFLGIKSLEVEKNYPNKVIINLVERVPIAQIQKDTGGERFLIDEDGYVLGVVDSTASSLPLIIYEGDVLVGNFIDFNIVPLALDVINYSKSEQLELSSMSFSGRDTTFYTNGSIETLLNYDMNIKVSMNIVSELVKKSRVEGKSIKKIDLRYDKVIVLYD